MEHVISFPGLGLEFTLNRVAVNLFGKDIYWYGIIICIGFILAALYVNARVKESTGCAPGYTCLPPNFLRR